MYACLYEHPEICAPMKEIHFFSRERFSKGKKWYESHFSRCDDGLKTGEFSTSYLYSRVSAERIARMYPEAKLIAILRNPIDRSYSQYCNSIKAGEITKETPFETFKEEEKSVLEQGKYAEQLYRYMQYFSKKQLLILIYEDIEKDPAAFIKKIYEHLEVNPGFQPTMLHDRINIARIPASVGVERVMHKIAEFLRKIHLDKLVWVVRKSKIPDYIRTLNTERLAYSKEDHGEVYDREALKKYFRKDVQALSEMLERDLEGEWL